MNKTPTPIPNPAPQWPFPGSEPPPDVKARIEAAKRDGRNKARPDFNPLKDCC